MKTFSSLLPFQTPLFFVTKQCFSVRVTFGRIYALNQWKTSDDVDDDVD